MVRTDFCPRWITFDKCHMEEPFEMEIPNYKKMNNQNKIAKLPKQYG